MIANGHYIGIDLEAGDHMVELYYKTPYLRIGTLVSLLGIVLFVRYSCLYEKWMGRFEEA